MTTAAVYCACAFDGRLDYATACSSVQLRVHRNIIAGLERVVRHSSPSPHDVTANVFRKQSRQVFVNRKAEGKSG
jgi:hypothetical protein